PRAEPGAGAELSVIEVHEAVRLVAHALEEEERARVGLQHHGILPSGQEDALGPAADLARRRVALDALLGEADDLEVREAELGEHRACRAELAEAAVDHEQVRQPAALARVAEAPAQHLGHRREVVRALDGADAVAAVAVLVGRPLADRDREEDLVRHVVVGRLVELREDRLQDLLVGELPVVEAVAAVRDQLAAAHEEDLDLDRAALAVEAEDVLVGAPVLDHLLALLRLLDRLDLVAHAGRLLEALLGRGGGHSGAEAGDHLVVAPLEEEHYLPEVLLVRATVDRQHAGAETALDVVLDAGAAAVAEDGVAARAQGKHLADRVERVAHRRRAREGAEVAAPVLDDPARHQHARPRIRDRDLDAHVALVVLQPDV